MSTYAIEMTAATNAAGAETTFYVSTGPLITGAADTPGNVAFLDRVQQPGSYRADLFAPGATGGASDVSRGEIVLINADGALDDWPGYGWSGRAITVRIGEPGTTYPASWVTVLRGTMEQVAVEGDRIVVRVRDRRTELDVPASPNVYAGSNTLPGGLEGTTSDLGAKRKPRAFGLVRNVTVPCVNTSRLIYQINDGAVAGVDQVKDAGFILTPGAAYTSQADMESNAPAAGTYRCWLAGGYIRLGTSPIGAVTVDATAHTGTGARAGSILRLLALASGIPAADISTGDVTTLNSAAPYTLGLWLPAGDETTCRNAMDRIAGSVGAWFGFDSAGALRMGRLTDPSGATPVLDIQPWDVLRLDRAPLRDAGAGIPAWKVVCRYSRNWTVMPDLGQGVDIAVRNWCSIESRAVSVSAASVKSKHLLAPELIFDTLIDGRQDAIVEAQRLLELYKVDRSRLDVRIAAKSSSLAALMTPGCAVRLTYRRHGLDAGKLMGVLGVQFDLAAERVDLILWG